MTIRPISYLSDSQRSLAGYASFDGEDELDSLVSAELAQYIDPERAKQEQKRLELAWAVRAKVSRYDKASTNRGAFFFSSIFFFSTSSLSFFSVFSLLQTPTKNQRKTPSAPCDCCGGSGTCGCEFCRGSGALTVGSERFCSLEDGCKECPACSGRGSVPCDACKGTGQRAAWLGPGCPVDD